MSEARRVINLLPMPERLSMAQRFELLKLADRTTDNAVRELAIGLLRENVQLVSVVKEPVE